MDVIALRSQEELGVIDERRGDVERRRRLVVPVTVAATSAVAALAPSFSPDGTRLAVLVTIGAAKEAGAAQAGVRQIGEIGEKSDEQRIAVFDVSGAPVSAEAVKPVSPADRYIYEYDWTPDSKSIVFWAGGHIQRINRDGSGRAEIPFRVNDDRVVIDPPRPSGTAAPATVTTRMPRFSTISPDEPFGRCHGELAFIGRDFHKIVLPTEHVFPEHVYFLYYANDEAFTPARPMSRFDGVLTAHPDPDSLSGS